MSAPAFITGNITRKPELRQTDTGRNVTNFGIAVNSGYVNDQKVWVETDTTFFDITCWDELAVKVSEKAGRGRRAIVTGRFKTDKWTDESGDHSRIIVIADDVALSLKFDKD